MVDLNRGTLVSRTLRQSWRTHRTDVCPLTTEQLESVTPLLYESGAAGLGWWSIRDTDLRETPSGELLHQAFRLLALRARAHETEIENLFRLFREANVEVIVVKGWAIARSYPEPALRPYGDIDLVVRPSDFEDAARVLQSKDARNYFTDLQVQMFELADRPIEEIFSRSQLVRCGEESVRVLAPEDHFALLSIHLLKHAAWRPLWLCDIGMLLDTMSDDFDWDMCLGRNKRRANWILSVAGLAHVLLDAGVRDEAVAARVKQVPDWLVGHVLKNWETPFANLQSPLKHRAPIRSYLKHPPGLLKDLARRWPDPILATVTVNGIFAKRKRMRYQFGNWLLRAARVGSTGGVK
jgi:hypothetical protein